MYYVKESNLMLGNICTLEQGKDKTLGWHCFRNYLGFFFNAIKKLCFNEKLSNIYIRINIAE